MKDLKPCTVCFVFSHMSMTTPSNKNFQGSFAADIQTHTPVLSSVVVLDVMYSVTLYISGAMASMRPLIINKSTVALVLGLKFHKSSKRITLAFTFLVKGLVLLNTNGLHLSGGWAHLGDHCSEWFNVRVIKKTKQKLKTN